MVSGNRKTIFITLSGVVAFFLAIAPVLDPYIILEIGTGVTLKVNDVLMLIISVFCFGQYFRSKRKTDYLILLLIGLAILTVLANLNRSIAIANSLKNLIIWFVYAIALSYIWKTPCRSKFLYWVEVIATVAALLVFAQFIAGYLGFPMWDGKLPLLNLSKYDGWAGYIDKNTGDIRPNSFFQEASYVGVYLSVAYAQMFKRGKLRKIILFAAAMLATTSMIAVVSCLVITTYSLMAQKNMRIATKTGRKIFLVVLVAVLGMIFLVNTNEAAGETFEYILKRMTSIDSDLSGDRMSSTKYRILGHIDLFSEYSPLQKLFGVGVAQYASYFNVAAYSNVWVTTLLNSGILGLVYFVGVLAVMLKNMKSENRIFFLILLMVFSSDYQWFTWYFFYLITACILEFKPDRSIVLLRSHKMLQKNREGM